ncbi:MAG: nucleoside-diphosphate sugar epimerase/dehydratase [Campylobacterota bacterium]|nr:nucleoside-diphosphate sugar epimerase/dehydratase [Campylobacterota bacterium]
MNKKILNFLVIVVLTFVTFWWTFYIFHFSFDIWLVASVAVIRILASYSIFSDYSLSWSKSTTKTFLLKSVVYIVPFMLYAIYYYGVFHFSFLVSELFFYLFSINFLMYGYSFYINKSKIKKDKCVVIYGSGDAGLKLESEFKHTQFKVKYFVDDNKIKQNRSIDSIQVISPQTLKSKISNQKFTTDMLVIAIPSADKNTINKIYEDYSNNFETIKILPSFEEILADKEIKTQLKDISVEDLLARHPKDLDKTAIKNFIKDKIVLVTGAGGSIGSEIVRQCKYFEASKIILLDHSEYNLYAIEQELDSDIVIPIMQSVVNKKDLDKTFKNYKPEIVIHAAAYKHVPLCEANIDEAIKNNVIGTKNIIDVACDNGVNKLVLISTDKAVRPTNVMGTTKRICELYAVNKFSKTEIVAVRFGNVLGSSGSVIPKFKSQIENSKNITVTHPEITRYFMLIPEACELVLQAGSLGSGGEIFILDMGEPIKIVDLANKMIKLSGKDNIEIEFSGLRAGEKLYEELLIDEAESETKYESITVAKPTKYDIDKLNKDIEELMNSNDKLAKLKEIVPEFEHRKN